LVCKAYQKRRVKKLSEPLLIMVSPFWTTVGTTITASVKSAWENHYEMGIVKEFFS